MKSLGICYDICHALIQFDCVDIEREHCLETGVSRSKIIDGYPESSVFQRVKMLQSFVNIDQSSLYYLELHIFSVQVSSILKMLPYSRQSVWYTEVEDRRRCAYAHISN